MPLSPRRLRRSTALAGALAVTTLLVSFAAAAPVGAQTEVAPAERCRADGPAAEALLPVVEPIVQKWIGTHPETTTPGMAIGIVAPASTDRGVSQTALITCGVLETGSTTDVSPTTRFELGSETKLFTATSLAQLVLAGRIDLDAAVQQHAPDGVTIPTHTCSSGDDRTMTLRDLATHDSGLKDDPANTTWTPSDPESHASYTRTDLWDSFTTGWAQPCDALASDPGTAYLYSDWGFALLGTILADRYQPGQAVPPYEAMIRDLVTAPLGMSRTTVQPIPPPADQAVPTCPSGVVSPCYWNNVNAFAGGGGAISDITDMAAFVRANLGFDTSNPAWPAIRMTQRPSGIGPACATCMGLAWEITPAGQSPLTPLEVLAKDGGTWGSHSQTYLLPASCWGITVLSNSDSSDAVGGGGVTGDLVKALGPSSAGAPCGAAVAPVVDPGPAAADVVEPSFTG